MQISPHPNISEKNLTPQKVSSSSQERKKKWEKKFGFLFFDLDSFSFFSQKKSLCEQHIGYVKSNSSIMYFCERKQKNSKSKKKI